MTLTPRGASDVLRCVYCGREFGADEHMHVMMGGAFACLPLCPNALLQIGYDAKRVSVLLAEIAALTTRSAALEAEKAELTARFEKYGDHLPGCPSRVYIASWDACTCGFGEIRVASPHSPAPESAVDALGQANE